MVIKIEGGGESKFFLLVDQKKTPKTTAREGEFIGFCVSVRLGRKILGDEEEEEKLVKRGDTERQRGTLKKDGREGKNGGKWSLTNCWKKSSRVCVCVYFRVFTK